MTLINKKHQLTSSRILTCMNTLTLLVCIILALCSTVPMRFFSASATHIASPPIREPDNPLTYTPMGTPESSPILPQQFYGIRMHRDRTSINAESLEPNDHEDTPLWKRRCFILMYAGALVIAVSLCVSLVLYLGLRKKLQVQKTDCG